MTELLSGQIHTLTSGQLTPSQVSGHAQWWRRCRILGRRQLSASWLRATTLGGVDERGTDWRRMESVTRYGWLPADGCGAGAVEGASHGFISITQ